MTLAQIESAVLAFFEGAKPFIVNNPEVQALATTAKNTINNAKQEALIAATKEAEKLLTPIFVPILGTNATAVVDAGVKAIVDAATPFIDAEVAKVESLI